MTEKKELFKYRPDLEQYDQILGLTAFNRVKPSEATIEPVDSKLAKLSGHKLVVKDLDPEMEKMVFKRLGRLVDVQKPLFTNVQSVTDSATGKRDVVANINPKIQEHIIGYLQDKGVELKGAPAMAHTDKGGEAIAWSKELATAVKKDLEAMYNKFDGNKSLKTQIHILQRDYLDIIQVDGAKAVTANDALSVRLSNFLVEATQNAQDRNIDGAKYILETLQERLDEATVEVQPSASKDQLISEKLGKLITVLRKREMHDLAAEIEGLATDPSLLVEKLDTLAESGNLGMSVKGPLNSARAEFNVERVSASMAL